MPPHQKTWKNASPFDITQPLARQDPPSRPTSTDHLPNELLQEIFKIHVLANRDTPIRLILVCKLWQSATADLPLLWTNIYYGDSYCNWRYMVQEDGLIDAIEGMVHCSTLVSLNRAIERTKNSKFDLTVFRNYSMNQGPLDFSTIDQKAVSERCRLLRFIPPYTFQNSYPAMVHIPLKALEELIGFGAYYRPDDSALAKNLRQNKPPLSTLFTATLDDELDIYFQLPLRKLSVRLDFGHIWRYYKNMEIFQNIEELVIEEGSICDQVLASAVQTGECSLMPCLRKVELPNRAFAFLPRKTYTTITHLTIRMCLRFDDFLNLKETISFPSLIYLQMDGSWRELVYFDAPNVVELVLRIGPADKWDKSQYQNYKYFKGFSIFPQILHIDSLLGPAELPQLLDCNGKNLKELRITYFSPKLTVSVPLTSALCGDEARDPICPLLWKFEVITPQFKTKKLYKTIRERLQQIIDARFSEGRFGKVRHALYPLGCNIEDGWEYNHLESRRSLGFKWIESL